MKKIGKGKQGGLFSSAVLYTLANFVNKLIPFILLPLLTRYLSVEEYGIVTMFNATASFLIPLVGMSIPTAIIRRLADRENNSSSEYVFNCLMIALIATMVVAAVMLFAHDSVSVFTGVPGDLLVFECLYTIATVICQAVQSVMQIREKVRLYAVFTNVDTLSNALLSVALIVGLNMGLDGRIFGLVISKSVLSIVGLVYLKKSIGLSPKINVEHIREELFEFGFPLIPTQIKTTVLTYTDKIFLTNLVSVGATGVYTVADQFASPISFLVQSFNLAFVPWLFKKLADGNEAVNRKIVKLTYCYFAVVPLFSILWAWASTYLIGWIAGESYAGATDYVMYLSIAYAFSGMHMMVVNYIYYAKKVKLYSLVTITVIFSNIFLNFVFLQISGPVGAAQATLLANVVSFALTWLLAARVWKMPWNLLKK